MNPLDLRNNANATGKDSSILFETM